MKIKSYEAYYSGSIFHSFLRATCITKAIKQFIKDNNLVATFELYSAQGGSVRLKDNYSICNDYIVLERK